MFFAIGGRDLKGSIAPKRKFNTAALLAASAFVGVTSPLPAQSTQTLDPTVAHALDSLPAGTPLRVYVQNPSSTRVDGRLLRYDRGNLLLNPSDSMARTMSWNINDVKEVYALGRRSDGWAFGHGAGIGALTGLGIGVGVTALLLAVQGKSHCSEICIPPAAASAVLTIPFTAVATIVGGFIGLGDRNKWRSVPIPLAPTQLPK
ncbi:MAG: hypothetical protein ABJC26_14005 [Gemmatimonadaceae bacterium]